ncbi:MAG TPA: hypothetical protein DD706_14955 [Nitrospiraceae bacterium]|nr:hypothetical protein [Nitrospiraceae bacterium]
MIPPCLNDRGHHINVLGKKFKGLRPRNMMSDGGKTTPLRATDPGSHECGYGRRNVFENVKGGRGDEGARQEERCQISITHKRRKGKGTGGTAGVGTGVPGNRKPLVYAEGGGGRRQLFSFS